MRKPASVRGLVVAVTGGARGIGLAIAQALATEGARVAIGDLDGPAARRAADLIGNGAVGLELDVTDTPSFTAFLDGAEATLGAIDVLISNVAEAYRARFVTQGTVRAVKSFDIAAAPYPSRFAFQGYSVHVNPFINIINRMFVIQFEGFDGRLKTLVWEPTVASGSADAPFYSKLEGIVGHTLAHKVFTKYYNDPDTVLPRLGLSNDDVDFVSFDHLHVQDVRRIMGSAKPFPGESGAPSPLFPQARLLVHRKELAVDNWQPEQSRIPGVKHQARFYGREVVLNANTLGDSLDQCDSMVKEKILASPSPRNPKWLQIVPSSECSSWVRQWPLRPSFSFGGLDYGTIVKPTARA